MIGVLTHHWAKSDLVASARTLLDGNGEAQSRHPGFVSRTTLISRSDPTKITTLVMWESNDDIRLVACKSGQGRDYGWRGRPVVSACGVGAI